jgi:hypothetical protein
MSMELRPSPRKPIPRLAPRLKSPVPLPSEGATSTGDSSRPAQAVVSA